MKNEAKNDALLQVIRHIGNYYDIIVKDVNGKELVEHKHEVEDLREANEELWKCLTKTNKELNEIKVKMEERDPNEEFDFKLANAIHDILVGCVVVSDNLIKYLSLRGDVENKIKYFNCELYKF